MSDVFYIYSLVKYASRRRMKWYTYFVSTVFAKLIQMILFSFDFKTFVLTSYKRKKIHTKGRHEIEITLILKTRVSSFLRRKRITLPYSKGKIYPEVKIFGYLQSLSKADTMDKFLVSLIDFNYYQLYLRNCCLKIF